MGRVARTEALYHGLLELLPDRMAEAGAHFRAMADGAEVDGAEATTTPPPPPERPVAGKCRWLLKPSRGYARDAAERRAIKKARRDRAIALYPF